VAAVRLGVLASATLRVSDRSPKVGEPITFSGQLRGKLSEGSPGGVVVALEFWNGSNGWQNAIARARTDRFGRFTMAPYTFTKALKRVNLVKVHAVVEASETDWPYETNASNAVTLGVVK
jgi:hypothetical protein